MTRRRAQTLQDLWLPGLVGLTSLLVVLSYWGVLVAERHDRLLADTEETARETRELLASELAQQVDALRALAELWSSFGLRPQAEWELNVGQRVDQVDGLVSVAWIDLDEPRHRIAYGRDQARNALDLDLAEARRHASRDHLEGPLRTTEGEPYYRVFLPVTTPSDHAGVLVGWFDARAVLDAALRARASGHAITVSWDGQTLFSRGTPTSDPNQAWWHSEVVLDLPLGGSWKLVHRPTAAFASARLTPLPHYLLLAGLVLSVMLAVVSHQLRLTLRQSRFLAASNRALERRGQELEARVSSRTEELEEAVAELEAFNYSVSHDLRSPLGAILNFAAILEEDYRDRPLDAEGVAILDRIRRSATRATDLLEDLLQLSRAGRAALDLERIDMTALARETFAHVRAATSDGDEVDLVVEPLPEALGDRTLLADVFANLFSNALKYSRGCEKRRVQVTGRIDEEECIYEVADNGQGFDMRFASKLFVLFERLHSSESVEGTGVGLAMVARIVKRHGGRVWAEGRPGEGASFSFALPAPSQVSM